eukprot:gene29622-38745_t
MRSNLDLFSFDLTSEDMLKLNSCSLNDSPPNDEEVSLIVKNRSGRPLQWYWSRRGSTDGFVVPSDDWILTEEISPYDTSYQTSWKGHIFAAAFDGGDGMGSVLVDIQFKNSTATIGANDESGTFMEGKIDPSSQQQSKSKWYTWRSIKIFEPLFERLFSLITQDPDILRISSKICAYLVWINILLSTLGTTGVDIKPILSLLSISALTVGFAAKDLLTDTFAGVSILILRPFQRGDIITVGGFKGTVLSIDLKYVKLASSSPDSKAAYSIADTSSGYILQRLETVLQDQLSRNVQVKVLVLPVDALGLANRLRIISSLYSIASVERQVLIVIWIPSEDCRINFSAIFSKFLHNNVIVISPPTNLPRQPGMEAVIANSLSNFSSSNSLSYGVLYIRKFIVDISLLERRVTLVYTRGSHSPSSLTCQEHLYTKSMFYQGLRLALPVEDIVNEVKFNYFAGSHYLFGVHVRAFDASYDCIFIKGSGVIIAERFDEASPLWSFITAMEGIIQLLPTARFFVCSNSYAVKGLLLARFGDSRILTLTVTDADVHLSSDRASERALQLAAAEFMLLGSTICILHSRGSSFAREAAAAMMIPVIDVSVSTITSTVDEIVSRVSESQQDSSRSFFFYSQHTGLPHCGMPEYISSDFTAQAHQQETHPVNSVADHTSKVCFQEAEDESSRVICSVRYRVCPCPSALETNGYSID